MNKSFIDKYFKVIMVTCILITTLAIGIIIYIKTPNPPPYTIVKTEDISNPLVMKGAIHIYTEAITERHLFDTAKTLSNTYNNYELLGISFYRDGDPVGYGTTVGSATVNNKKVTHVDIYNQETENALRESVKLAEQEAIALAEERSKNQPKTKQIAQFTGSSNKQTKKIKISSEQFTIKSRLSPDNEYALLIAYLYNSDGTLNALVANTTDNSPAETTIYGAGEYYLDVAVANGKYNIRVIEDN